ncbi:hypothetical protein N0V90_013442 [Kalmusia sp. IMI 367209]|nr:hypothetical protein N0V90_013442 [Kalmusia sp. IMI 367209]
MNFRHVLLLQAVASAFPQNGGQVVQPEAAVMEALFNPELYNHLTRQEPRLDAYLQSPSENIFRIQKSKTCGAVAGCPAWEGEVRELNGREYRIYCYNAPHGAYRWLPRARSLEQCEQQCHDNNLDCNGLTYYPLTQACSIIHSNDAAPYIFDVGVHKFGAIPVKSNMAFGAGMICPLPGSDNQVYDFKNQEHQFKMSCRNQFKGPRVPLGPVKNVYARPGI